MTAQELNTYINRVLGNSIRCLLPSYWWKRLLTQIVEYVYEVDVKADAAYNSIRGLMGFTITTSGGSVKVSADGKRIDIPDNTTRKVNFTKSFEVTIGGGNVAAIDTSMAYTSNVINMSWMFGDCEKLTSLDVSNFDTSNVTDMSSMFSACKSLTTLDLSNFDTSEVTDMSYMFSDCSYDNPQSLDLTSFDTSNVTDMTNIFSRTSGVKTLALGEGFFKTPHISSIDFSYLWDWEEDSFIQSVVTNSYDRAANGLSTLQLLVDIDTYAFLTEEHKGILESKGYTIESIEQNRYYDG